MDVVSWEMVQGVISSSKPQNINSYNTKVDHYFIWIMNK